MLAEARGRLVALLLAYPALEQAQRVVPERIDLHGLAAPRRHHPVADLGVHPGELIAVLALAQQAVVRIDADAEARAAQMVLDDVAQLGQQQLAACARSSVYVEVAVERVEEPERGVGGVIQALASRLPGTVGDQAVADVMGEGAQDVAGLAWRPVVRVSPSRLIIVSRPQSVNQ